MTYLGDWGSANICWKKIGQIPWGERKKINVSIVKKKQPTLPYKVLEDNTAV